jgi:4-alpha-glucanotransferase
MVTCNPRDARNKLASKRVLSYRLLWFEKDPPIKYPELALAAVTTHDLPTIAGLWTGADLEEQRQLELNQMKEVRWRFASACAR